MPSRAVVGEAQTTNAGRLARLPFTTRCGAVCRYSAGLGLLRWRPMPTPNPQTLTQLSGRTRNQVLNFIHKLTLCDFSNIVNSVPKTIVLTCIAANQLAHSQDGQISSGSYERFFKKAKSSPPGGRV